MIRVPPEPAPHPDRVGTAKLPLRFEDVSQDGRVLLDALPAGIGPAIWAPLLEKHPMAALARKDGVVAILSRVVIEGLDGPIPVSRPLAVTGTYELAHTLDAAGEVERILLLMWARYEGVIGRTYGASPRDGETARVGSFYAEHVFTRPFGAPEHRRVNRLDGPGVEPIPGKAVRWQKGDELLLPPEGCTPLEPALAPDAAVVFGVGHTDGNQHVNSLVYPRRFEEGVLRRLATLGRSASVIPRAVELAFRKPFFAGERARLLLQTFTSGTDVVAVGAFVSDDAAERPHCWVRMRLSP